MQTGRQTIQSLLFLAAVCLASGAANSQGVGGGLKLGTPGSGLEFESLVIERFGIHAVSYNYDEVGIRYDGTLRFGTGFLLADWHPYASGFRLSGGVAYNNQRFLGTAARPGAGTINISSANYSSAQLSSLDGRVTFSKASPYLGVGWGLTPRAGSRLYFSADVGVTYQRPSATLLGGCSAALTGSVCSQLQSDLRAEEAELHAADDFRLYPVISVGFGLRF